MNKEEAIRIATKHYEEDTGEAAYPIGANRTARHPNQWAVLFEYRSPSGKRFDGPIVVIVQDDGIVRFF